MIGMMMKSKKVVDGDSGFTFKDIGLLQSMDYGNKSYNGTVNKSELDLTIRFIDVDNQNRMDDMALRLRKMMKSGKLWNMEITLIELK